MKERSTFVALVAVVLVLVVAAPAMAGVSGWPVPPGDETPGLFLPVESASLEWGQKLDAPTYYYHFVSIRLAYWDEANRATGGGVFTAGNEYRYYAFEGSAVYSTISLVTLQNNCDDPEYTSGYSCTTENGIVRMRFGGSNLAWRNGHGFLVWNDQTVDLDGTDFQFDYAFESDVWYGFDPPSSGFVAPTGPQFGWSVVEGSRVEFEDLYDVDAPPDNGFYGAPANDPYIDWTVVDDTNASPDGGGGAVVNTVYADEYVNFTVTTPAVAGSYRINVYGKRTVGVDYAARFGIYERSTMSGSAGTENQNLLWQSPEFGGPDEKLVTIYNLRGPLNLDFYELEVFSQDEEVVECTGFDLVCWLRKLFIPGPVDFTTLQDELATNFPASVVTDMVEAGGGIIDLIQSGLGEGCEAPSIGTGEIMETGVDFQIALPVPTDETCTRAGGNEDLGLQKAGDLFGFRKALRAMVLIGLLWAVAWRALGVLGFRSGIEPDLGG